MLAHARACLHCTRTCLYLPPVKNMRVHVLRGSSMHAHARAFVSSLPGAGARRTSCVRCPQKAEPVAAQSRMAGAAPLRDANSEVLKGLVVGKLQSHARVGQCGSQAHRRSREPDPRKDVLRTAVTPAPQTRCAQRSRHGRTDTGLTTFTSLPPALRRAASRPRSALLSGELALHKPERFSQLALHKPGRFSRVLSHLERRDGGRH
jgi:hypothetical protein